MTFPHSEVEDFGTCSLRGNFVARAGWKGWHVGHQCTVLPSSYHEAQLPPAMSRSEAPSFGTRSEISTACRSRFATPSSGGHGCRRPAAFAPRALDCADLSALCGGADLSARWGRAEHPARGSKLPPSAKRGQVRALQSAARETGHGRRAIAPVVTTWALSTVLADLKRINRPAARRFSCCARRIRNLSHGSGAFVFSASLFQTTKKT